MVKYKFSNTTMFAIVMRDEEVCKEFIERLFPDKKVRELHFPEDEAADIQDSNIIISLKNLMHGNVDTEKSIINGINSKSVRLDVLFEDSDSLYNIEMQVGNDEYLPQRTRYYHSAMSVNSMKKGSDYGKLKKSYVIFVCMYDPFKLGKPLYQFEMRERNLDLQLNDGTYTMLVNIKCPKERIPKELEPFYTYVDTGEVDERDPLIRMINERVEEVNNIEEASGVMTLEEEITIRYNRGLERGEQIGIEKGAALKQHEIAKNLKNAGISLEIIAQNTGLDMSEIEKL